jgi:hypothetical protein
MLAGVGTTWYTWLEQGRDVRPSNEVLAALAGGCGSIQPNGATSSFCTTVRRQSSDPQGRSESMSGFAGC